MDPKFSSLEFTTTEKAAVSHGVKMLVYGDAGVGKTRLCSTAPKPLILSAESGLLSLKHVKVPVIVIKSYADLILALEWCKTEAVKMGILTVCLDSFSEVVEMILAKEKAATRDGRKAYGEMATEAIRIAKEFRDLPGLNVIITCKEEIIENPMTGTPKAIPTAPGQQVAKELRYLFDQVFHAYTGTDDEGTKFWGLETQPADHCVAKDRSGKLSNPELPDLTVITNKIMSTGE